MSKEEIQIEEMDVENEAFVFSQVRLNGEQAAFLPWFFCDNKKIAQAIGEALQKLAQKYPEHCRMDLPAAQKAGIVISDEDASFQSIFDKVKI